MEKIVDGFVVIVDDEDANLFVENTWRVKVNRSKPYLFRHTNIKGRSITIYFHRHIKGALPTQLVDHINGNSLDNRRINLRIASVAENNRNTGPRSMSRSRFKGVDFNGGRWRARIRFNYAHIELGRFMKEVEAAHAYDIASIKYHGEFGRRNFLPLA